MAINVEAHEWARRQIRLRIEKPILEANGYNINQNALEKLVNNALYGHPNDNVQEDLNERIQRLFMIISNMRDLESNFISDPINALFFKIFEIKKAFVNPIKMEDVDADAEMQKSSITLDARDPSMTLDEFSKVMEILNERKELNELIISLNPLAEAILRNIIINLGILEIK
jgi:hypothetical protein